MAPSFAPPAAPVASATAVPASRPLAMSATPLITEPIGTALAAPPAASAPAPAASAPAPAASAPLLAASKPSVAVPSESVASATAFLEASAEASAILLPISAPRIASLALGPPCCVCCTGAAAAIFGILTWAGIGDRRIELDASMLEIEGSRMLLAMPPMARRSPGFFTAPPRANRELSRTCCVASSTGIACTASPASDTTRSGVGVSTSGGR